MLSAILAQVIAAIIIAALTGGCVVC